MPDSTRVFILSPVAYDYPRWWTCVVNMVCYSWSKGITVEEMGITEREVVHWARNQLARAALDGKGYITKLPATHFLWLDSDHAFNPWLLERLLSHNVDIVGALYYSRTEPNLPIVYVKDHSDDAYKHYPLIQCPDSLFTCDAIGFGAVLMRREVLERVPEPWFSFKNSGEDIYFCVNARRHGFQIHCDGAMTMGHIGPTSMVTQKTYADYMQRNQEKYQDRVKIDLTPEDYRKWQQTNSPTDASPLSSPSTREG